MLCIRQQLACHHEMLLVMPMNAVLNVNDLSEDVPSTCSFMTLCNQTIAVNEPIPLYIQQQVNSKCPNDSPTVAHEATVTAIAADSMTLSQHNAPLPNDGEKKCAPIASRTAADDGRREVDDGENHRRGRDSTLAQAGAMQKKDSEMESGIESDSEDDDFSTGRFLTRHGNHGDRASPASSGYSKWNASVGLRQRQSDISCRISAGSLVAALYDPSLSIDEFIARAMIHPPPSTTDTSSMLSTVEKEHARLGELIPSLSHSAVSPIGADDFRLSALDVTLEEKYAQLVTPPPPPSTDQLDIDKILSVLVLTNDQLCDFTISSAGNVKRTDSDTSPKTLTLTSLPSVASSSSSSSSSSCSSSIQCNVEERSTCSLPPLPPPLNVSMIDRRTLKVETTNLTKSTSRKLVENCVSTTMMTSVNPTPVEIITQSPLTLERQLSLPVSVAASVHGFQSTGDVSRPPGDCESPSSPLQQRHDYSLLTALYSPPSSRQRRLPVHGFTPPPILPKPSHANSVAMLTHTVGMTTASTNGIDVISAMRRPLHPPPSPPPRTSSVQNSPIVSTSGPDGSRHRDRTSNKHRPDVTTDYCLPGQFCNQLSIDCGNDTNQIASLSSAGGTSWTPSPPPSPSPLPPPLPQVTALCDSSVFSGQTLVCRRDSMGSAASDVPSVDSLKTAEIRQSALRSPPSSPLSVAVHRLSVVDVAKTSSLPRDANCVLSAHTISLSLSSSTSSQCHQGRSMSLTDGGKLRSNESRSVLGTLRNKFRSYWNRNRKSSTTSAVDYDYRSSFRSTDGSSGHDLRRKSPSPSLLTVPSYRSFAVDVSHVMGDTGHVTGNDGLSHAFDGDGDDVTLSAEDNFRHWSTSVDGDAAVGDEVPSLMRGVRGGDGSLKSFTGNS